jgi:hypothetical protein
VPARCEVPAAVLSLLGTPPRGQNDEVLQLRGPPLHKLTYRAISLLYIPLAASWVLMLAEAPLINAFLARGPDPEVSLAAFGVAYGIILVVEGPILMMLELSVARSKSWPAFRKIRSFYVIVGLAITGVGLALFYTPLCQVFLCGLMGIPQEIAQATVPALRVIVWWPLPIGWRRIHQGILINDGRTRIIGVATALRLVVLLAVLVVGQSLAPVASAVLATSGMVLSVIVEAGLIHWAAQSSMRSRWSSSAPDPDPITFRYLWSFYPPLAITTVLRQGIRPVITAGIAAAPAAELSLAAWPVAFSLSSIFWGPTMALRQVTIALADDSASWHKVSRFVLAAGLVLTAGLGLVSFTPLLGVVLKELFGLSEPLAAMATPATRILVLLPSAYALHGLFTGLLVKRARTSIVRTSKALNLGVVGLTLFLGVRYGGLLGAVLGSVACAAGALFEAIWLYARSRPTVRSIADPNTKQPIA